MKILNSDMCRFVSGGACESISKLSVNSNSEWKGFTTNGLYLLGSRVEDKLGNIIFEGTSGSFTHDGIVYTVKPGTYNNKTITEYTYTSGC